MKTKELKKHYQELASCWMQLWVAPMQLLTWGLGFSVVFTIPSSLLPSLDSLSLLEAIMSFEVFVPQQPFFPQVSQISWENNQDILREQSWKGKCVVFLKYRNRYLTQGATLSCHLQIWDNINININNSFSPVPGCLGTKLRRIKVSVVFLVDGGTLIPVRPQQAVTK